MNAQEENGMNSSPDIIPLTEGALLALRKTRFWMLFLGVVGVILAVIGGVMILAALLALHKNPQAGALLMTEGAILMVIFILFSVWQLGYSGALRRVTDDAETANAAIERALIKQRNLWVTMGVIMIVVVMLGIAAGIFSTILGHDFFAYMQAHSYGG